jgi:hypothetical protein
MARALALSQVKKIKPKNKKREAPSLGKNKPYGA